MAPGTASYTPRARAERLIIGTRAVLAALSLLAIWLDPSEPSKFAGVAYTLLAIYLAYAVLLLPLIWVSTLELYGLGLFTHIVDLLAFTSFIYFTDGPTSPFFVYYVFSLFCAALRWQRSGTFWTGAVVLALFIGLGIFTEYVLRDPAFQVNRFIIRSVYLGVVALLLGYMSGYEAAVRGELAKLAFWPAASSVSEGPEPLLHDALAYAAKTVGAPRILMVWDQPEEPGVYLASLERDRFETVRAAPGAFEPPVARRLRERDFLCPNSEKERAQVLFKSATGFGRWQGAALHPELRRRFRIKAVLSLRLPGEDVKGRLFFMDKSGMTTDDLALGAIIARHVAAVLDRAVVQQRLQAAAVMEERLRFARELHDGLLQSLAGLALQLEAVRRSLPGDHPAQKCLDEVQDTLATEQRGLRTMIQRGRPARPAPPAPEVGFEEWLGDVAARIEAQWRLRVEFSLVPVEGRVRETLLLQIQRLSRNTFE